MLEQHIFNIKLKVYCGSNTSCESMLCQCTIFVLEEFATPVNVEESTYINNNDCLIGTIYVYLHSKLHAKKYLS